MQNIKKKLNKAQSTMEYMVVVTGVIAVLIVFMNPRSGPFKDKYNEALSISADSMVNIVNELTTRYP